jgi:fluoroquinolone resistance protein
VPLPQPRPQREYEGATFAQCDFTEADLAGVGFTDCTFTDCNFSLAKLHKTAFRQVKFGGCKLVGLPFEHCHQFLLAFSFERCLLDYASFARLKIRQTRFVNCSLLEADFAGTDLNGADFAHSNLDRAIFAGTLLEGADFTTAHHFQIDPSQNRMEKARFSVAGLAGLLAHHGLEIVGQTD